MHKTDNPQKLAPTTLNDSTVPNDYNDDLCGPNQAYIRFSWCPCGKREFLESNYINNKDENKKMLCHLRFQLIFL